MANPNTQKASGFTNHYNELIKKEFLENFRSKLVIAPLGQKSIHPLNSGDTVRWLKFDDLNNEPADVLISTEAVDPDGDSLTDSNVEAQLQQYGNYVTIGDRFRNYSVGDIMAQVVDKITRDASTVVDRIARNALNATTNNDLVSPGTNSTIADVQTNTTELASDDIKRMVSTLRSANVPTFDDKHYRGIIHPKMEFSLMNESGAGDFLILSAHNGSGSMAINDAEIGKMFGANLMRTTEIAADATSTSVYENIFLGKNSFGTVELQNNGVEIIVTPFSDAGVSGPLHLRSTVAWKITYVAKILQSAGVRSLHAYGA